MTCEICGSRRGPMHKRGLNGLPAELLACDRCRERVRHAELGVTLEADVIVAYGRDGRGRVHHGERRPRAAP